MTLHGRDGVVLAWNLDVERRRASARLEVARETRPRDTIFGTPGVWNELGTGLMTDCRGRCRLYARGTSNMYRCIIVYQWQMFM